MRAGACAIAISLLAFAVPAEGSQTVVRWKEGYRDSGISRSGGRVVKTLGANGVAVSVAVSEQLGGLRVDLTVDNGPARAVLVDPRAVSVTVEGPSPFSLARHSSDRVADLVERDAWHRAASKRIEAMTATKTVVTTTTSQEPVSGIRDYTDPNQQTYTKVETKVETVPDDHTRHMASHEAHGIEAMGRTSAGEIRRATLRPTRVARSGMLNGVLFFEPDPDARHVVVAVEIDGTIYEIPFERVTKGIAFFGRRTVYR